MKKLLLTGLLALLILTSCQDGVANASIEDKDDVILKVNDQTLTKEVVWNMLKNQNQTMNSYILSKLQYETLASKIEITDEIKSKAKEELENYKVQFNSFWQQFSGGKTDEELIEERFIPMVLETAYFEKYFEENKDTLLQNNQPVKLIQLTFTDEETANKALADLNNNIEVAKVIETYPVNGITNVPNEQLVSKKSLDKLLQEYIDNKEELNTWVKLSKENTHFVAKVIEVDSSKLLEEYKEQFFASSVEKSKILQENMKQMNLKIYDLGVHTNATADENLKSFVK